MKYLPFLVLVALLSCSKHDRSKLVIKTIPAGTKEFVEWYRYNEVSGPGIGYVSFIDSLGRNIRIYQSFYISDISFRSNEITIGWYQREPDNTTLVKKIGGYPLKFDSTGCLLWSADMREAMGNEWSENICTKGLRIIQSEREDPTQYQPAK